MKSFFHLLSFMFFLSAAGSGAQAAEGDPAFAGRAIAADDVLGKATARENLSLIAESNQSSTVSGAAVSNVDTGDISMSGNAFQNASGPVLINANSGNNVAMNASLNVNIIMTGPQ